MNELDVLNTEAAKVLFGKLGERIFKWIPEPINKTRNLKKQISKSEIELTRLMLECGYSLEEAQAHKRVVEREKLRMINYMSVVAFAAEQNINPQSINKIDLDWLNQHYERASMYSNTDLQRLWGRILAGETEQPGSYSKQVLSIVDLISPHEAEIFQKLLSFLFYIDGKPYIIIHSKGVLGEIKTDFTYNDLIQLQGIGLISIDSSVFGSGYNPDLEFASSNPINCRYFQNEFTILPKSDNRGAFYILNGIINLTFPGKELLGICGAVGNQSIISTCVEYWNENGNEVTLVHKREKGP